MSQTIAFTSTELAILASYVGTGTGSLALNPQAQNITEASRNINLKFNIGNKNSITHDQPPQLTPPQQIRQIIIGSTTLTNSSAWNPAWASAVAALRAQGKSIQPGAQPVNKAQHVTTSQGQLLVQALAATGVSTATVDLAVAVAPTVIGPQGPQGPTGATGPQGVVGPQGPAGQNALDVSSFEVDASGNLIVMFGDSSTVNLGNVKGPQGIQGLIGPPPVFTIGTVTTAALPSVTISGTPPNYVLDFELEAGPAGPGSGDVSTLSLYSDPAWITSLAASKVGLGNVTNESKATMFASPTFTGTVAGVTATMVGLGNVTNESKATMFSSPTFVTPVLGTPASGNLGSCTVDGTNTVGYINIPQNSQSAAYTLTLADAGKHIFHPSSDTNVRTYTIPADSSVAYPVGTVLTFINMTSQLVTIEINTDTMHLSGSGTTGSRTLAQYGSASAIKITPTSWLISGIGLT